MPQPSLSGKVLSLLRRVIRDCEDKQYRRGLKAAEHIHEDNPKHRAMVGGQRLGDDPVAPYEAFDVERHVYVSTLTIRRSPVQSDRISRNTQRAMTD
ncbi:hypothetical protein DL771_012179 [Monosporascus sp. 5C6A]|nr:hypothetical protein DL771_012179 [Monosporascus sp. 5C6A]